MRREQSLRPASVSAVKCYVAGLLSSDAGLAQADASGTLEAVKAALGALPQENVILRFLLAAPNQVRTPPTSFQARSHSSINGGRETWKPAAQRFRCAPLLETDKSVLCGPNRPLWLTISYCTLRLVFEIDQWITLYCFATTLSGAHR